jgi:hypothetical protein
MQPVVMQHTSNGRFYLVGRENGDPVKLKSLVLIAALKEAKAIEPNVNLKYWVDWKNSRVPILFEV